MSEKVEKVLFIIYTPYVGYLPKRMKEIEHRTNKHNTKQVVVTPDNYKEKLEGLRAETIHLIKLYPEHKLENATKYYEEEPKLHELVETLKIHNI